MSSPLHAAYYADQAIQVTAEVVANRQMARDTFRIRFRAPEMARLITPGQFLMLRLSGCNDPLIGRPLALYDTVVGESSEPWGVDVVYLVKGKLTTRLAQLREGQQLDVWGPLGNGFLPQASEHLVMVAGGIGQTPFMALAREYLGLRKYGAAERETQMARQVTLCYGARSADYLSGVEDFEQLGVDVRIATDDGSRGRRGFVTDELRQVLDSSQLACRIVCCGPEPMMEAVAELARERNVPCQVSLETPMACGIGICFTCVAKVRDETGDWDYKRTCVEGPVFDAAKIDWSI
ncbi:MAG: dihydroorotate dehydrogenase electron transfer subunit [Pirellulaceae bacterium]